MKPTLKQRAALRRNKYGNKPTFVDGIRFASKAEAKRYQELKLLERAGEIGTVLLQPRFLLANRTEQKIKMSYVGDFQYFDKMSGTLVVEDVKGMPTKEFKVKWAWVQQAFPGYDFRIVKVRA